MNTKPINILLVEDDDVDAEVVIRGLKKQRITNALFRAKDGVEALELLRGEGGRQRMEEPYLLLVDINMPRMNGLNLLAEMRDDPKLQKSIVFMLTTSEHESDKCAAYKKNVAGYLLKSNVGEDFMKVISLLDHFGRLLSFLKVQDDENTLNRR